MSKQSRSHSEAMWMSSIPVAALLAVAAGICHNYEKDYYAELGCKAQTTGEDGCPTSYDCSSLSGRSLSKCYYRGQVFEEGHALPQSEADVCLAACRCGPSYPVNRMVFKCANVECPDVFSGPPPPGCYRTYEHEKCCYVNEVCGGSDDASKPVCKYNNKEYHVGERFWPDEEPCLQCICQPGYNGSLVEPFCKKIHCNLELNYADRIAEGCVPQYYGHKGCCPIDWVCPENVDTSSALPSQKDSKDSSSGPTCQFGGLTLKVGDRFSPRDAAPNTECTCRVPPHPVCIIKADE